VSGATGLRPVPAPVLTGSAHSARAHSCSRPTNVNNVASGGHANRTGV
jgi:hypothetical protein